MDNLRIKGLNNVVLTGEKPVPGKEYLVAIKAELEGITKDLKDEDNPTYTYLLRYLTTEMVQEIGSKTKLKVQNGKSPSQKLRWAIETEAKQLGVDKEEHYESVMNLLIAKQMEKINDA